MKEKLLNEESYKKINKGLLIFAGIVILAGLSLMGFGIYKLIAAGGMHIPSMGDDGWFDANAIQGKTKFAGYVFCMIGLFIVFAGGIIISIPFSRKIMAYQTQTIMPVAKESMEEMAPTLGKVAGAVIEGMAPTMEKMAPTIGKMSRAIATETAPVYGMMAKEVAKGIKEGLAEEKVICNKCGAQIDNGAKYCDKCGKKQ